ncbi:hypothetical protein ADK55_19940 [Streptomyces sp. WM4235]|nr:hypothetical protein ADK55_19940 [Streptomyces sp. WM4235]
MGPRPGHLRDGGQRPGRPSRSLTCPAGVPRGGGTPDGDPPRAATGLRPTRTPEAERGADLEVRPSAVSAAASAAGGAAAAEGEPEAQQHPAADGDGGGGRAGGEARGDDDGHRVRHGQQHVQVGGGSLRTL